MSVCADFRRYPGMSLDDRWDVVERACSAVQLTLNKPETPQPNGPPAFPNPTAAQIADRQASHSQTSSRATAGFQRVGGGARAPPGPVVPPSKARTGQKHGGIFIVYHNGALFHSRLDGKSLNFGQSDGWNLA